MNYGVNNSATLRLLSKNEVTIGDMIEITVNESNLLRSVANNLPVSIQELFRTLYNQGFFLIKIEGSKPESVQVRNKDFIYYITSLMGRKEGKPELINTYREKYRNIGPVESKNRSPIPDIKTDDYYFSSVLVAVERGVIELEDGINFYPDKTITGHDCFKTIKKIAKLYKD